MIRTALTTTALALASVALLGLPGHASAAPAPALSAPDAALVQNVDYQRRWWRRHRDETRVRAPFTDVDTGRGTWVRAPFARVYSGPNGTWVRAPFVNRFIPR